MKLRGGENRKENICLFQSHHHAQPRGVSSAVSSADLRAVSSDFTDEVKSEIKSEVSGEVTDIF